MSDTPGGPGWWQASDAKWYPPQPPRAAPPPPGPAPVLAEPAKRRRFGCGGVLLAGLGVLVLLYALGSLNGDDDDADASAELACRHFRNVAADYSDGHLTLVELRDKLVEVNDDAQYSDEPGVASSASLMLAAITAANLEELATHVAAMGRACDRAGL